MAAKILRTVYQPITQQLNTAPYKIYKIYKTHKTYSCGAVKASRPGCVDGNRV